MLAGWQDLFCKELYNPYGEATYDDDCVYSLLCLLNGYTIVPSRKISVRRPAEKDVDGLHDTGLCLSDPETIKAFAKVYERTHGRSLE